MCEYNKVIFVSKENLSKSPMAEWIFNSILMDKSKEICSRGLVVLFPEPMNPKVYDLLRLHGVPCGNHVSQVLGAEEFLDDVLIITMNSIEKIKIAEEYGISEHVYTLNEFVEEEGEVPDPYGGEEEEYENCYIVMRDLLYKMKKKLNWR